MVLLPEATQHVAVRGRQRRDLTTTLVELGQSADQRRAEVRDDDVDLLELGDIGREDLLGQRGIPVRHLERLLADERVLVGRVEDLVETLVLLDALAVALGAAQHEHVAALREDAEDPLAPVLARLGKGRVDEDVVVDA